MAVGRDLYLLGFILASEMRKYNYQASPCIEVTEHLVKVEVLSCTLMNVLGVYYRSPASTDQNNYQLLTPSRITIKDSMATLQTLSKSKFK